MILRLLWSLTKSVVCFVAGTALLCQIAVTAALYYFDHSGQEFVIVTGGSMEPAIDKGDAILLNAPDPEKIKPGVVVTYRSENNVLTTHRVLKEKTIKGEVYLQTQGDANDTPDPNLTAEKSVIGLPERTIVKGGYIAKYMTSKEGRLLTIVPALLIILFGEIAHIVRVWREEDVPAPKSRKKSRSDLRKERAKAKDSEALTAPVQAAERDVEPLTSAPVVEAESSADSSNGAEAK